MATVTCPVDGDFEAELETRVTDNSYDAPVVDAKGQYPTLAEQLESQGVTLTRGQWADFAGFPNGAWEPTFKRTVVPDDRGHGVEHQFAICPTCGSPIKVG